jgi:hypothetical protein
MSTIHNNTRTEKTARAKTCLSFGKIFPLISIVATLLIISLSILIHLGSPLDTSKWTPGRSGSGIGQPATASPSSQAMPVGDLPGWKQIFTEDFTIGVPVGSFVGSVYDRRWFAYPDGWLDTAAQHEDTRSRHMPSEVVSVQGLLLNKHLHDSGDGPRVAALVPQFPDGEDRLYGRFSVRFRTDSLEGYKVAWLLWPVSEVWPRDGEIDFPEGPLDGNISAFMHRQGATSGDDKDVFETPVPLADGWHTATIEWTEDKVVFILNDEVIGTSTSRIPNTPMRWVLQTETCIGNCQPAPTTQGNLQIDWVVVYEPVTSISASPTFVSPGGTVTASVLNGPGNTTDWIGLYQVDATDSNYVDWKYLNGSQTAPSTGLTSANIPFTMPSSALGDYEFRLFSNDGYTRLAISGKMTVGSSTNVGGTVGETVCSAFQGIIQRLVKRNLGSVAEFLYMLFRIEP